MIPASLVRATDRLRWPPIGAYVQRMSMPVRFHACAASPSAGRPGIRRATATLLLVALVADALAAGLAQATEAPPLGRVAPPRPAEPPTAPPLRAMPPLQPPPGPPTGLPMAPGERPPRPAPPTVAPPAIPPLTVPPPTGAPPPTVPPPTLTPPAPPTGRAPPPAAAPRAATPTAPAAAGDVNVRVERGRITADVGQVPIAGVLARIARDVGAPVLVRGDLGITRPQSFANAPLLDGLERLLAPNHLVIEFGPERGDVEPRILRIRVFGIGAGQDTSLEPLLLATAGGAAGSQPAARLAPAFDGRLGWDYADLSRLPPLAQRVRRIGGIYAVSGEAGLTALRTVLEADPDTAARAAAVRAAGAFPYDQAMPLLQQALTDENADVRLATVAAINPGPDQPPTFLVDIITDDGEDERVRLGAIERLGRYRLDGEVQDMLQDIAASDETRIGAAARGMLVRP